jgi:K+-sensing histidine kinase KdpD
MRRLNRSGVDPAMLVLRGVCHELRPPMTTLTALLDALGSQPAGPRRDQLAQLAAEHAAHAREVLDQAAAAAHGLTGPEDRIMPLHRVLPAVTAVVPGERLAVAVTPRAARCAVRPRHLRQVLINLLVNADRYAPPGSTIRLTGRTAWNRLHLTVADQGRLTADLARALHRTAPPPDEKGLGVWITRHLVAAQGGTLRARQIAPRGMAIELSLPRRIR